MTEELQRRLVAFASLSQSQRHEPKRLRLRILTVGGRIVTTARRRLLKIDPPGRAGRYSWSWGVGGSGDGQGQQPGVRGGDGLGPGQGWAGAQPCPDRLNYSHRRGYRSARRRRPADPMAPIDGMRIAVTGRPLSHPLAVLRSLSQRRAQSERFRSWWSRG